MSTRHHYRIYVRATAEQVWQALLDPGFTRRYFHGTAFDVPPAQGHPYRTSRADGSPAVEGTIEVLEPPRRLVQTWRVLYDAALAEEPPSRVEWTVSDAAPGLVRIDLVHGDLAASPGTWAQVRDGWVWILDSLKSLLETGEPLPSAIEELPVPDDPDGAWHRSQAIAANGGAWAAMAADPTPQRDEELLRCAYASAYHWQRAAGRSAANEARARYLESKAHLVAGDAEVALRHAEACLAVCVEHGLVDFDLAYAHEARARALVAVGRDDEGLAAWASALSVEVRDPEDRAILDADFADAPLVSEAR